MPTYHYHYYATAPVGPNSTGHLDGIIVSDEAILSYEDYAMTKQNIANKHSVDVEKLTVCSLTRLA